jgi:hypothetical protein
MPTEQDYAPTWPGVTPEGKKGDKIVGKLIGGHVATTKRGKDFTVLHLEVDGAEVHVPAWHFMLDDLLEEVQPQIGETVEIENDGTKELGDGRNPMRLYKVNGRGGAAGGTSRKPAWLQDPNPAPVQPTPLQQPPVPSPTDDDDDDIPFLHEEFPIGLEVWHGHENR